MSSPEDDPAQANGDMGSGHEAYGNLGESQTSVEVARPEDSEEILVLLTAEKYSGYPTQRVFVVKDPEGRVVGVAVAGIGTPARPTQTDSQVEANSRPIGHILDFEVRNVGGGNPGKALKDACYAWMEEQGADFVRPSSGDQPRRRHSPVEIAERTRHPERSRDNDATLNSDTGMIYLKDGQPFKIP